jgi:hypothetical protein
MANQYSKDLYEARDLIHRVTKGMLASNDANRRSHATALLELVTQLDLIIYKIEHPDESDEFVSVAFADRE